MPISPNPNKFHCNLVIKIAEELNKNCSNSFKIRNAFSLFYCYSQINEDQQTDVVNLS